MTPIVRLTAFVVVVALSFAFAPHSGHAGAAANASANATPANKNCFFVRNNLPCPCPKPQQARAVARAAHITFRALGTAMGTTTAAITSADHKGAPADARTKSRPAQATPTSH